MKPEDIQLIKTLCSIHAPSGNEVKLKEFLLKYIEDNKSSWSVEPQVIVGDAFQDCILVKVGEPRTVIFVHMDSIGFTVRYNNQLIPIGGPNLEDDIELVGEDSKGAINGKLKIDKERRMLFIDYNRLIDTGTELVFRPDFIETNDSIQCAYMDNRLSVFVALKLLETLENGIIAFSCWEEHGGGSVGYLAKYIYEQYQVRQALIADITWVTEGVMPGEGVVISLRDKSIPRKSFVNKVIAVAQNRKIKHQLEVEGSGGSDGKELQSSPYPYDWCFVGAPEVNVHTPMEIVNKQDILSMIEIYKALMEEL